MTSNKKGCLIIIIIGLVIIIYAGINAHFNPYPEVPGMVVSGDIATMSIIVDCESDNYSSISFSVASKIYNTAKRYPDLKKIEITLYMSGHELIDKYGNKTQGNLSMGTISRANLDEIRKYVEISMYSESAEIRNEFESEISRMNYSYLLKGRS